MDPMSIQNILGEMNPEALLADGFEDALIGYAEVFNKIIALYDRQACIEILMKDGMSEIDAIEFFEFNVVGAYMGADTPAFATILKEP